MTLPDEDRDLEFPRRKRQRLVIAATYRLAYLAMRVFGTEHLLRFAADEAWILRRVGFELASELYGESFQCASLALSEDSLERWLPANANVLDLGCGAGRWSRAAATRARSVVGIDRDVALIARARSVTRDDRVTFLVGDVTRSLPEQVAKRFDIALLVHLLEHLDDVDPFLRMLHELTPRLIVEVPDVTADPLNVARRKIGSPFYSDDDHVREYSPAMLVEHLGRNGWRIRESLQRGGAIAAFAIEVS